MQRRFCAQGFELMFISLMLEIHNSKLQIEVFSAKTIKNHGRSPYHSFVIYHL